MVRILSTLATYATVASATMMPSQYWQGGNLMSYGSGSASVSISVGITVVAVNNGGGAKWQNMNGYEGKAMGGKTIEVVVGGTAGLIYTPSTVNAEIGDIVQFNFMSKNHTVTQSTFPIPCKKMDGGMDSGFMPNAEDGMPPPAFKMKVTKKDPLWFYCRQKTPTSHCGKGMVFSINPTADKSQDAFLQAAIAQNGTAAGTMTAAVGGMSTIVAPPAAAASTMEAAPPAAAAPPPPAEMAPPAAAAAAPPPSMAEGSGSGSSGSCSCSCLCGVSSYPAGMGLGMYGGMSGAMPMPAY